MNFKSFVEKTKFSPTYAANCVLYKKDERPAIMATLLEFNPTDDEKVKMRKLIAGKGTAKELFNISKRQKKTFKQVEDK